MILEIIGATGTLATLVAIFVSAFFVGGRRWRGNYEAEHVRAERLQATLVEKDLAIEEKDRTIDGMSSRLARLDEERKEFGGTRVYEAILGLSQTLGDHERQSTVREERMDRQAAERQEQFLKHLGEQTRQILSLVATIRNGKDN